MAPPSRNRSPVIDVIGPGVITSTRVPLWVEAHNQWPTTLALVIPWGLMVAGAKAERPVILMPNGWPHVLLRAA